MNKNKVDLHFDINSTACNKRTLAVRVKSFSDLSFTFIVNNCDFVLLRGAFYKKFYYGNNIAFSFTKKIIIIFVSNFYVS